MTYPKVGLVTKRSTLTFPKSIAASGFLDLQDFRQRETETETETETEKETERETERQREIIYSMECTGSANNLWNVKKVIRKSMLESKR